MTVGTAYTNGFTPQEKRSFRILPWCRAGRGQRNVSGHGKMEKKKKGDMENEEPELKSSDGR